MKGGLHFDASAIGYTNSLFILLYLFPLHWKERRWYQLATKWIYVVINGLCILINLADTVFFEFRGNRTTMAVFEEFGGENNLGAIVWHELLRHWYLVILFCVMVYGLWRLYRYPPTPGRPLWRYYVGRTLTLAIVGFAAFCGMRGNVFFLSATRPISVNYAFRYVDRATDTGAVLNTPFCIIRTIGETTMPTPNYFTAQELDAIYTPLHTPSDTIATSPGKNLVIFMIENFSQEFVGRLNPDIEGYEGYMPFIDSMLDSCLYYDVMIANAGFSIDAPPAILASIPRMDRPFVVTPHSLNHINSLPQGLGRMGYTTSFFHGGDNESLGIQAFTRQAGVQQYFGMNEYYADPRTGGKADFDGYWGIWDEEFMQYFCTKLSEMPQPFMSTLFTLSAHHPYAIPEKYKDVFVDRSDQPVHKCISYTDYALKQFFAKARTQPWFKNTIFIITADHASPKRTYPQFKNEVGSFRVPILFYDPSDTLPRGRKDGIVQQIDIMPTMLNYLGYKKPYVAFGIDIFNTKPEDTWAFTWDQLPQYFQGDHVMYMVGDQVSGLFNYKADPLLQTDLRGKMPQQEDMERRMRAIIQSYLQRMNSHNVTADE